MARTPEGRDWICCQIGAREHYAIPRALHGEGRLRALVTDAWVRPGPPAPRRMQERYHPDLERARVVSHNLRLLRLEATCALSGVDGWDRILRRNGWFQEIAARALRGLEDARAGALFAYSYGALAPLEHASSRGWRMALGQIDPGPAEERLVERLNERRPDLALPWRPAPARYWDGWRRECELAEVIVVNSRWARDALASEGVPGAKLRIVPLAYDAPVEARAHRRSYPVRFDRQRPLRLLHLGQVALRKGMAEILEAMERLQGLPIEWRFVGPAQMAIPASARSRRDATWTGAVPRGEVARHYRECDAFLFPTHSDGFGLTQLEARAWGLPILASRFCGEVVRDGVDGVVLPEVTADAVAGAVHAWLEEPARLAAQAQAASAAAASPVSSLGGRLLEALER